MWWYWLGGAVVLVIAIIAYLLYRGYSKVKPKPIPGESYCMDLYSMHVVI